MAYTDNSRKHGNKGKQSKERKEAQLGSSTVRQGVSHVETQSGAVRFAHFVNSSSRYRLMQHIENNMRTYEEARQNQTLQAVACPFRPFPKSSLCESKSMWIALQYVFPKMCPTVKFHQNPKVQQIEMRSVWVEASDVQELENSDYLRAKIGTADVALDQHEFMSPERIHYVNVLLNLRHQHVVQVYGVWKEEKRVVIEWVDFNLRVLQNKSKVPIDLRLNYSRNLISGLSYLHGNQIMHRAIKPDNVFLCGDKAILKLGGFWLPNQTDEFSSHTPGQTVIDTLVWSAPELHNGGTYSLASDVYSCGMVIYFLLTGQQPYAGHSASKLVAKIGKELPKWDGFDVPASWIPIIESCWHVEPKERPSAKELYRLLLR